MVTEKDRLILDVINDVREELSDNQLEKLKLSLFQRLLPLDVKTAEANIVPYEQTNEQFIELWLAAKRMDCCSEGTIRAYKYTAYDFDKFIKGADAGVISVTDKTTVNPKGPDKIIGNYKINVAKGYELTLNNQFIFYSY